MNRLDQTKPRRKKIGPAFCNGLFSGKMNQDGWAHSQNLRGAQLQPEPILEAAHCIGRSAVWRYGLLNSAKKARMWANPANIQRRSRFRPAGHPKNDRNPYRIGTLTLVAEVVSSSDHRISVFPMVSAIANKARPLTRSRLISSECWTKSTCGHAARLCEKKSAT